jgi:hypothetical protein
VITSHFGNNITNILVASKCTLPRALLKIIAPKMGCCGSLAEKALCIVSSLSLEKMAKIFPAGREKSGRFAPLYFCCGGRNQNSLVFWAQHQIDTLIRNLTPAVILSGSVAWAEEDLLGARLIDC